jgi:Integrase core domain
VGGRHHLCTHDGGFLYLALVLDPWSRRIVGGAMANHLRAELVLDAMEMAVGQPRPKDVIHHSGQGSQYTSVAFGKRCGEAGVRPRRSAHSTTTSPSSGTGVSAGAVRGRACRGGEWRSWPTIFSPNRESSVPGQVRALPSDTQGRSRVPELGSLGSVGGRSAMDVPTANM